MYRVSEKCTSTGTGGGLHTVQKIYENMPSEAWFPSYGVLRLKKMFKSVHLELRRSMLHLRTVTVWLAGKFQVSYQ